MTWALLGALVGVAIVDSINPSALAMTMVLLSRPSPDRVAAAYIAGILCTYFTVGALVVIGGADVVERAVDALAQPEIGFALEALLGLVLVVFCLRRKRPASAPTEARRGGAGAAFLTGVAITAVEATTALPYLGALALVVRADLSLLGSLAAVGLYNVLFVLPPVALVLLHRASPTRAVLLQQGIRRRLSGLNSRVLRALAGLLGVVLLLDATIALARGGDALG